MPISEEVRRLFSVFDTIEDVHSSWLPLVESLHFLENPSHVTLAETLRRIAKNYPHRLSRPILPWPLAACLRASDNPTELEALAALAEAGKLGKLKDWLIAEKRWRQHGVTVADISHMTDDHWPFTNDIAERGFPFAAGGWSLVSEDRAKSVINIWDHLPDSQLRAHFSPIISFGLEHGYRQKNFSSQELEIIEQALISSKKSYRFMPIESILNLLKFGGDGTKVCEIIDAIGQISGLSYGRLRGDDDPTIEQVVNKLLSLYKNDSSRKGIVRLISKMVSAIGMPKRLDMSNLVKETGHDNDDCAVILSLTQNNLSEIQARTLATQVLNLSSKLSSLLRDALNTFENYQMNNRDADVFLEELFRKLPVDAINERSNIVRLMLDIISRRTSGLDQSDVWSKLKLPEGLYTLLRE